MSNKYKLKVKEDNEEISMMERQIVEAQEKARSLTEARDQLDQDLEENQSERNQKYRELKKREAAKPRKMTDQDMSMVEVKKSLRKR